MGGKAGGSGESVIIGYRYFFDLLMGLCRGPVDEITSIKVGDRVAWSGSITGNTTVQINAPNLYGGDDKEGGIVGPLVALYGAADQVLDDGPAQGTITFNGQPGIGDTVTINGQVFTFAAYVPPDEPGGEDTGTGGEGGSSEGGGSSDGG